jgi:copper oxidase (laccase) domain-containing protein
MPTSNTRIIVSTRADAIANDGNHDDLREFLMQKSDSAVPLSVARMQQVHGTTVRVIKESPSYTEHTYATRMRSSPIKIMLRWW